MKKIRMVFILLFVCSCLLVQGCSKKGEQGDKGIDGREVILQVEDGYIKWQYEGETTWKNLISLTSLTGVAGKDGTSISNITIDKDNNLLIILSNGETKNLGNINGIDGINGQDGREVTFKVENDYIKWQYVGDTTWTNLIELSSLIGPKGDKGTDGIDGREVIFKVENGYIKWQYVGDTTWTNLIELSSLIGPKGDKGNDGTDGREVTFKVESGYIKWQYVGDTTWINLIELSSLIGPKGDKGNDGQDGKDGKSAYEIYKETHPEYTKSEEEWLDDLVNGRLGTKEETKYTVKFVTNTTDTIADQIVTKGEKVTKPADPVKEGYIFDGWYIDDEKWVFSGYTITSDITLTARFIKIEEESFSLNNSIKENDIYKVVVSNSIDSYNFRLNVSITGYSNYYVSGDEYGSTIHFTKQVQLNEGNNYYYILCEKDNGDIDTYRVNIYRNRLYKVEFNTNTTSKIEPKQVEEGTILTNIETVTKEGYTFKGWDYDFTKPITSNLIVNAIWEANKYTITYNPNGGTINRDTQQATYDSDYTLMEPTYEGHAFMGWYYNDRLFDNTGIWKLTTNITLTANWSAEFNIIYILDGGTNDSNNPTKYYYTTETINLKDPTKVEAIFDGWYREPEFINKVEQIEKGSTGDIALYAKFIMNKYTLIFETNGGTSIEQVTADYGTKLNITTTRKGYEFVGWFKDSSLSLSSYYELGETMPNENLTLYAKWKADQYKIVYYLDGGTNNYINPRYYTIETETINLKDPTKVEAVFGGWYTEPEFINKVDQIEKGSIGDITLYAKFTMNKYTLTFETNGGTSIEQVTADYGTLISIENPTKEGYIFDGWYKDESFTTQYVITTMPHENITLYAKWVEYMKPYEANGSKYIYFGEYPQTLKQDSVTIISNTPDSNGYYLGSDGELYAKVTAKPYLPYPSSIVYFNNKQQIVEGTTYYFKVEPIKWKILQVNGTEYKLVTDLIIDNQMFHSSTDTRTIDGKTIYPNNYEHSDIRKWLNEDFYTKAFTKALQSCINTTLVDNSIESTGESSNQYICNDTYDKVYLLSCKDVPNKEYGFAGSNISREKQLTDYAKAKGCYMATSTDSYNNGIYWLRSPLGSLSSVARDVDDDGNSSGSRVDDGCVGVSAAITISLS